MLYWCISGVVEVLHFRCFKVVVVFLGVVVLLQSFNVVVVLL